MCGIAGLIAWDERDWQGPQVLAQMSRCIAHRGPDGEGIQLIDGPPRVGLVHRRLAILDPDPRANQPFANEAGQSIVFNGEIYNFRELHRQLSAIRPDYAWRTTCDTEVLLLAYSVWKERCLEKLEGMFAFAVWDGPAKQLFLARDRMGQKPLFYAHLPGRALAFGSEIPAISHLPWVDRAVDPQNLCDYLTWGYMPRGTIYGGISKLPPGCWAVARDGIIEVHRWFDPNPPARSDRPETVNVNKARELLLGAVQRQLVSDVPLGCFLSGGVDSSIVAAAMRAAVPRDQPVLTFSIGFEDPRYDETRYAAEVARHLGTEHRQFVVKPDAAQDLPKLAAVFGEPFGDSSALPTHYLARETRKHVKVALSGDGGDELFGGYDRYRAMRLGERLGRASGILRNASRLLPGSHPKGLGARARRFAQTLHLRAAQRYAGYLRLFDPATLAQLLPGEAAEAMAASEAVVAETFERYAPRGVVEAALATDRAIYLPDDLLAKVDRCAMLHALEVRSPFMDHTLVHFAAGLPEPQLLRGGGKRLLRLAFARDLPPAVFTRRKMGFAVPVGEWFRTSLREMLHDALFATASFASSHFDRAALQRLMREHETGQVDHSQRLYALLMLELWWPR